MAKNSFVLYTDYYDQIKLLSDEDAGKLLRCLMEYVREEKEPEFTPEEGMLTMAFSFIRAQIDRDAEKYKTTCESRKEAGSKGGTVKASKRSKCQNDVANVANASFATNDVANASKSSKSKQNVANVADNDNDNDNDNDIKKENVKRKASDEPKHTHGQYKHVRLTDSQYNKLGVDFGEEVRAAAIKRLDEYIQEKPNYKSNDHNLAIRRWVIKALQEDKARGKPNTGMLTHDYDFAALEQQLLGGSP